MIAPKLKYGDKIGIISPSHIAEKEFYSKIYHAIKSIGFDIVEGKNIYKNTYGYIASEDERADDFNDMMLNKEVKMIFFGGGYGNNEIVPFVNYDVIKFNPKIICSYSDGTTILNIIYSKTGLVTYYGQSPSKFIDLRYYDYKQFISNFVDTEIKYFVKNSEWKILNHGVCEGILIGGYTDNMALLIGNKYFSYDKTQKYILFLENYENFCSPAIVSEHLAHIEQNDIIKNINGLLFGHYSEKEFPELEKCLERFGQRNKIPVIKCDDFGHGKNHGIIPIGQNAKIDTEKKMLEYI
jgi:muramoyltetrapeptide carboxypeptidase